MSGICRHYLLHKMAKLEKKIRSQTLSNFTRNVNSLISLLDCSAPSVLVSPQFNKMKSCWDKLESAQESFIATTEIDIDTHQDGLAYLDEPGRKLGEVVSRYSEFLEQERESEKVERQKKVEENSIMELGDICSTTYSSISKTFTTNCSQSDQVTSKQSFDNHLVSSMHQNIL